MILDIGYDQPCDNFFGIIDVCGTKFHDLGFVILIVGSSYTLKTHYACWLKYRHYTEKQR